MSEGEMLQIEKERSRDITEDVYYSIIKQKTASLIASCCGVGAASSGASQEVVDKMKTFGEYVGMAFQLKDDLFDYGTDDIGKPLGIDIKEKKLTLPLIYALQNTSWLQKKKILRLIRSNNGQATKVSRVIEFVDSKGGIQYAQSVMQDFYRRSIEILDEFEESDYKNSLKELVTFTIDRDK